MRRYTQLKQQRGKDILVYGSDELAKQPVPARPGARVQAAALPVIIGKGKRLFRERTRRSMKLEEVMEYASGVVLMRYRPIGQTRKKQ